MRNEHNRELKRDKNKVEVFRIQGSLEMKELSVDEVILGHEQIVEGLRRMVNDLGRKDEENEGQGEEEIDSFVLERLGFLLVMYIYLMTRENSNQLPLFILIIL